jgi:hypothetical protein
MYHNGVRRGIRPLDYETINSSGYHVINVPHLEKGTRTRIGMVKLGSRYLQEIHGHKLYDSGAVQVFLN